MTVKNIKDLKVAYILLNFFATNGVDPNTDSVKSLKREIRSFTNKPASEEKLVKDYGVDGAVVLFPLPARLDSMEAAVDYFMDCEYIHSPNSAYDCTGRCFTSWFKIVEKNGRFWAYHSIARDV